MRDKQGLAWYAPSGLSATCLQDDYAAFDLKVVCADGSKPVIEGMLLLPLIQNGSDLVSHYFMGSFGLKDGSLHHDIFWWSSQHIV